MCGSRRQDWKRRAADLRREVYALYLACRDPRTPWYAKAFGLCVIGYALSPIDLIPDVIPVLGHLDELVLIPLGLLLVRRLIPRAVLEDCRLHAEESLAARPPVRLIVASVIVLLWIGLALLIGYLAWTLCL